MNNGFKTLTFICITAAALSSCAKSSSEHANISAKRALESWLSVHDIGQTVKTGHGVYITGDVPGTGAAAIDSQYVFLHFRYSSLEDSSIVGYTDEEIAKQIGTYKQKNYYGSSIHHLVQSDIPTGVIDLIHGSGENDPSSPHWDVLRIGGWRKGLVPGWLSSTGYSFDTEEEYLNTVTGTNYIYELRLIGLTDDIEQWQQDTIQKWMARTGKVVSDSTSCGVWYYRDREREKKRGVTVLDTVTFPSDTTIYINYIGRLIDGKAFDTNIKDTAKLYGLYSEDNDYEPVSITWSSDSTSIKMSSSSVINGFAFTLWQMHPFESGRGIFPSRLGYGNSGNMPTIPGYAPLIFDIDIVEEPE